MYLFPPVPDGVIGSVVSDDSDFSSLYLLCSFCLKGTLVALPYAHGGQDSAWFVAPIFSIILTPSEYSLRKCLITLLFSWLSTSLVFFCLICGVSYGPFFDCYLARCLCFCGKSACTFIVICPEG